MTLPPPPPGSVEPQHISDARYYLSILLELIAMQASLPRLRGAGSRRGAKWDAELGDPAMAAMIKELRREILAYERAFEVAGTSLPPAAFTRLPLRRRAGGARKPGPGATVLPFAVPARRP